MKKILLIFISFCLLIINQLSCSQNNLNIENDNIYLQLDTMYYNVNSDNSSIFRFSIINSTIDSNFSMTKDTFWTTAPH